MEGLGFSLRSAALLNTLTLDVLKSSEIEGEVLNVEQVRSSIARRLGMEIGGLVASDRHVEGVVERMLDVPRKISTNPLTPERLKGLAIAALFPTGYSGMSRITVGGWRNDAGGPMQVVSGPLGHERIARPLPPQGLKRKCRLFWTGSIKTWGLILS